MAYPYPNVTNFPDLFTYSNTITDNYFGISLIVLVYIVIFMWGSRENVERGFAAASFITMLWSFFLGALNLVNGNIVLIFIILTGISIFILKRD